MNRQMQKNKHGNTQRIGEKTSIDGLRERIDNYKNGRSEHILRAEELEKYAKGWIDERKDRSSKTNE